MVILFLLCGKSWTVRHLNIGSEREWNTTIVLLWCRDGSRPLVLNVASIFPSDNVHPHPTSRPFRSVHPSIRPPVRVIRVIATYAVIGFPSLYECSLFQRTRRRRRDRRERELLQKRTTSCSLGIERVSRALVTFADSDRCAQRMVHP